MSSLQEAVTEYLSRCTRVGDCLISPTGSEHYGEVKWSGRRMSAHRAVATCRDGEIPDGQVVRHTCDTPGCAEETHLISGSQSQNILDAYQRKRRTKGWRRGDTHPHALMTEDIVCELRRRARAGETTHALADDLGFGYSPVRSAIRGESWKHVTEEAPVVGRKNKLGNPARYTLAKPDQAREVLRRSQSGQSLQQIAQALGISRSTAFGLRRAGVSLARQGALS